LAMSIVNGLADAQEPQEEFLQGLRPLARVARQAAVGVKTGDHSLEALALDESHDVEGPAVLAGADIVDRDDPRVLQLAGLFGLVPEAGALVDLVREGLLDLF